MTRGPWLAIVIGVTGCAAPTAPVATAPVATAPVAVVVAVDAGPPVAGRCVDLAWGGYTGTPACAELAQRVVVGADRACTRDADCGVIGGHCDAHALATADPYRSWPAPCSDPQGGQCPAGCGAVCQDGCCAETFACP